MKIEKLDLTNFRCFESTAIKLNERLTVFVGENGGGKTSITDALAIAFDRIVDHYMDERSGTDRWHIEERDIHLDARGRQAESASIQVTAYPISTPKPPEGGGRLTWTETLERDGSGGFKRTSTRTKRDDDLAEYLGQIRQKDVPGDVPLCVYYGIGRDIPKMGTVTNTPGHVYGLQDAFDKTLNASGSFSSFAEWFLAIEGQELRHARNSGDTSFRLPQLEAVRRAVGKVIKGIKNISSSEPAGLMVSWDDGKGARNLSPHQLSGSQRSILSIVADLAYRLAIANQDKKAEEILASECIVLIDEIDLQLHPKWQQHILQDLQDTFTGAQFIITTRSPFVVTTAESDSVRIVYPDGIEECFMPTYGAKASDVAGEVFDITSQRPPNNPIAAKISKMFDAIDRKDSEAARKHLSELRDEWARDYPEPDLVRADIMIRHLEYRSDKERSDAI